MNVTTNIAHGDGQTPLEIFAREDKYHHKYLGKANQFRQIQKTHGKHHQKNIARPQTSPEISLGGTNITKNIYHPEISPRREMSPEISHRGETSPEISHRGQTSPKIYITQKYHTVEICHQKYHTEDKMSPETSLGRDAKNIVGNTPRAN